MAKKSRQGAQRDSEQSPSSYSASWSSVLATIFFALLALGYIYLGGEEPPDAASAASSSASTPKEISPLSPLCGIGKVPGKGYGITAVKDISLGTRILQERPLLTLPAHIHQKDVARHLVKMVDALPPLGQTVFYTLANTTQHKLGPSPSRADIIHNIYHTNAVLASDTDGQPSSAIFPTTARINHGCRPNAVFFYRDDLNSVVVHTLRDVSAGEEILISYYDAAGRTATERQEYLEAAYGFKCTCSACSAQGDALIESDERRRHIASHSKHVEAWMTGQQWVDADDDGPVTTRSALNALEQILRLLDEEDYTFGLVEYFVRGLFMAASLEDGDSTRTWAALAADRYAIEAGEDSPHREQMIVLAEDPTAFAGWGSTERPYA